MPLSTILSYMYIIHVHVYCGLIYYQWRKSELPIENRKPEASY